MQFFFYKVSSPRFFVVFAVVCQRLNRIVTYSRELSPLEFPLAFLFRIYFIPTASKVKFRCLSVEVSGSDVMFLKTFSRYQTLHIRKIKSKNKYVLKLIKNLR